MPQSALLNKCQTIASYSLFRVLYDENKDVYAVLKKMLLFVITSRRLHSIRLSELEAAMTDYFEMSVPQSVIKTVMHRMYPDIIKENNTYYVKKDLGDDCSFNDEVEAANGAITELLTKLYDFIDKELSRDLSEHEKNKVQRDLFCFLMDSSFTSEFLVPISKFVIKNRDNETLKKAKEGILLFQGLKETKGSPSESPFRPLIIYFGMDVLFDLGDLNDSVFTESIKTLMGYISEINKNETIIQLKFFSTEKDRIEKYFNSVESDFLRKSLYKRNDTASFKITKGITSAVDIVERKEDLFRQFKQNHILVDSNTILAKEDNWLFNQLSVDFYDDYLVTEKGDNSETEINRLFEELNNINILRRNCLEKEILNSKVVFLTRQVLARKISDKFLDSGKCNAPLVCSVDYLVNLFWYKLGKGFGSNLFPACLSALVDAQVIIASMVKKKVSSEYDKIFNDCKEGKISSEQLIDKTYAIRAIKREPSDIDDLAVDHLTNLITDEGFEQYLDQTEQIRSALENQRDRNDCLEKDLISTKAENKKLSGSVDTLTAILISRLESDLESQKKKLSFMQKKNTSIETFTKIAFTVVRVVAFLTMMVAFLIITKLAFNVQEERMLGLELMTKYDLVISFFITCILFFFPIIKRVPNWILSRVVTKLRDWFSFVLKFDANQVIICEQNIASIEKKIATMQELSHTSPVLDTNIC